MINTTNNLHVVLYTKSNHQMLYLSRDFNSLPTISYDNTNDPTLLSFETFKHLKDLFGLETEYVDRIKISKIADKDNEQRVFLIVKVDDKSRLNLSVFQWIEQKIFNQILSSSLNLLPATQLV